MSLVAVHLSDGAITDAWIYGGDIGAAVLVLIALWRLPEDEIPRIGVLTAAFFVGSAISLRLPVLPASVHLLLNGLVGVLLRRRAGLAIAIGMTMQFFLFAHGGFSTIGINTCIVGIPALVAGWLFPLVRRVGVPPFAAGCLLGLFTAAATVFGDYFVLVLGGKVEDWVNLARLILLANLPVVVIEGLIVGFVVQYLNKVRPEMLNTRKRDDQSGATISSNGTSH